MRAACYVGDRTFTIVESSSRPPGRGEVELDIAYTGICGTDLHAFRGTYDRELDLPVVLGHEMSGTVAAIGPDVDAWEVGDRVAVNPLQWCGTCPACVAGSSHVCQGLKVMGFNLPGSMQDRLTVPARALSRVPDGIGLDVAALTEPTAVAVHDVRRAGLRPGEQALVVGGGPIGVLIALVARADGADVRVVELGEERRRLAESLGLTTFDPGAGDVRAAVEEWTQGAGVGVSFEVSGSAGGVDTAIQALAVRGRMVVVALHESPPPVDLYRVFMREISLVGARVYETAAFDAALGLLGAGEIPAQALITRVEPLEHVEAAFLALEQGQAMKILLDCSGGGILD